MRKEGERGNIQGVSSLEHKNASPTSIHPITTSFYLHPSSNNISNLLISPTIRNKFRCKYVCVRPFPISLIYTPPFIHSFIRSRSLYILFLPSFLFLLVLSFLDHLNVQFFFGFLACYVRFEFTFLDCLSLSLSLYLAQYL